MKCKEINTEATYEPPRMTIVPIRCSGAMLTGSAVIGTMTYYNRDFFYDSEVYGGTDNTATEWSSLDESNSSDWGTGFF